MVCVPVVFSFVFSLGVSLGGGVRVLVVVVLGFFVIGLGWGV